MRILATADFHVRSEEDEKPLSSILKFSRNYSPDVIIISGDVFHSRNPSMQARQLVASYLKDFSTVAPTIVVQGNHDASMRHSQFEIYEILKQKNLFIVRSPKVIQFLNFSVICLPWIFRRQSQNNRLNKQEALVGILDMLKSKAKGRKFLAAHATVLGSKFGGYRDSILGNDIILPGVALEGFDFCFFGHIHKTQTIAKNAVYVGSPKRIDFGEREEPKGFYTYDGEIHFHDLHPPDMFWFKCTTENLKQELENATDGSKVRVTLTLERGETVPDIDTGRFESFELLRKYKKHERRVERVGVNVIENTELYFKDDKDVEELVQMTKGLL